MLVGGWINHAVGDILVAFAFKDYATVWAAMDGDLGAFVRGAINNGVTKQEMKEIFLHVAVYAGAPALLDGISIARKVWAEHEARQK